MPENKNHHFVPKTYLKRFAASETSERATNLVNIEREQVVLGASIKAQCKRPYLHGKDPTLEKGLGYFEGRYSKIVGKFERHVPITDDDMSALAIFTLFQRLRTVASAERITESFSQGIDPITKLVPGETGPKLPDLHEGVLLGLSTALKAVDEISDLKLCVFQNRSGSDFITSDNPVVVTNRWMQQSRGSEAFGLGSAGTSLWLPMTPKLLLGYFDTQVYSCPGHDNRYREIRNVRDVRSFNELQVLNAGKSIYFADAGARESILSLTRSVKPHRPTNWSNYQYYVDDPNGTDAMFEGKRVRRVNPEELQPRQSCYFVYSPFYPKPSCWFGGLRVKRNPTFYETGTGAGILRKLGR